METAADVRTEFLEPLPVVVRHRDRKGGAPAGFRLARTQLPPLHLEERPLPRARLEVRQPLPDQVFDVVFEQEYGDARRRRHVGGREQKIRDTDIDVAGCEHRAHRLAHLGHAPLPQVDRIM
jgi:hypothetical protein